MTSPSTLRDSREVSCWRITVDRSVQKALDLLAIAADAARREIFTMWILPIIDFEIAKAKAQTGDLDGAIELARTLVDAEFASGQLISRAAAVTLLVDFLLERATAADSARGAGRRSIDWRPTRPNRESSSTRWHCSAGVHSLPGHTATPTRSSASFASIEKRRRPTVSKDTWRWPTPLLRVRRVVVRSWRRARLGVVVLLRR